MFDDWLVDDWLLGVDGLLEMILVGVVGVNLFGCMFVFVDCCGVGIEYQDVIGE